MKNSIFTIIITIAALILSPVTAHADRTGSGGTTGGGDYFVKASALLPVTLKVRQLFSWPQAIPPQMLEKRWCPFGDSQFWPCGVYAQYLQTEIDYRDGRFDVRFFGLADAIAKRLPVMLTPYTANENEEYILDNAAIETDLRELVQFPEEEVFEWNGETITEPELVARDAKIEVVLFNQLDPEDLRTLHELAVFDDYLKRLTFRTGIQSNVEKALVDYVKQTTAGLMAMAQGVLNSAGQCDIEKYRQLLVRLNNFKVGTHLYFDRMKSEAGWTITPGTQKSCQDQRVALYELVMGSVMPVCEAGSGSRREFLDRLPILLEE